MPPPVTCKNVDNISSKLGEAVVAKASMIQVAVEIKEKRRKSDTGVSFDGTWQRRGHSSLNGLGKPFRLLLGKFWTAKFYQDIVIIVLYIFL